jgi:Restriction endonuclease fold toxin 5
MAALAAPVIEAVVTRVLVALGITVAAGTAAEVAKEAARKRQHEAGRAQSSPIARTETQTKTKEKCKECPSDKGTPFNRPTSGWSEISIAYQARIGGLPVGPGFITEWMFNGVTFDGFESSQCLLKEAKAQYDQFFDSFHLPLEWWARSKTGEMGMIGQARTQYASALPKPPVRLRWYFMEPISHSHFTGVFAVQFPTLETELLP